MGEIWRETSLEVWMPLSEPKAKLHAELQSDDRRVIANGPLNPRCVLIGRNGPTTGENSVLSANYSTSVAPVRRVPVFGQTLVAQLGH